MPIKSKVRMPSMYKLLGYAVAWSIGFRLGRMYRRLKRQRYLIVHGREKALHVLCRGKVIIAATHPSLPDDFIVASTLWPHYLFNQRFFIWSIPDERLLRLWKMSPL